MFNAGRKVEVIDGFGVWVPDIIKEKINEALTVYLFAFLWLPY